MKKTISIPVILLLITTLTGCLTVQYKEYVFHFDDKNSGTLTITYKNIYSTINENDNADSVLHEDLSELITKYLTGNEIESNYPDAKVKSKKLFEKNGQLYGEIVLEFTDPSQVHLFKYDKKSPWMYYVSSDEQIFDGNGVQKAKYMPVVFWDRKTKGDLILTTNISNPEGEDQSLLDVWKATKK